MTSPRALTVEARGDREIVMTRAFDAPRQLVFEALTRPELVRRWLGVFGGWSMVVCEIDLRVGGAYRYVWRGPDGASMEMRGRFQEIVSPERLVVTEAFGGEVGAAAASSYLLTDPGKLAPVSGSVSDTRSEVCWAAVAHDGHSAFVTNFGDGTISSYDIADDGSLELREAIAGSAREGEKGIRDEAITRDGNYLYAIDADAQRVFGWTVRRDGQLDAIGAFEGVPETVAGLAAS